MRIGTNLSGVDLTAQRNLMKAFEQLTLSNQRLSTMSQLNCGSDNPSGLIAAGQLEAELASLEAASRNASRATGTIRVADSALAEVSELLNTIRGNALEAVGGGLGDDEMAAKQIEVNAALDAINTISSTTSFGGRKLLDGSQDGDGATTFLFSPDVGDTVTLSLPNVNTSALGGDAGRLSDLGSGGPASIKSGQMPKALDILDNASSQITGARGSAGAVEKYTVESSQNLLDSSRSNISRAISTIRDTDVAQEASSLIRAEILFSSSMAALSMAGESRGAISGLLSQ